MVKKKILIMDMLKAPVVVVLNVEIQNLVVLSPIESSILKILSSITF